MGLARQGKLTLLHTQQAVFDLLLVCNHAARACKQHRTFDFLGHSVAFSARDLTAVLYCLQHITFIKPAFCESSAAYVKA
eukprot:1162036-Pelagomonas_calceolata.AAC.4